MVQREKTRTKEPRRCLTFERRRGSVPVSRDFGRSRLPPHWSPRFDADMLSLVWWENRIRFAFGGLCPSGGIW